jgi:hypothetical protein
MFSMNKINQEEKDPNAKAMEIKAQIDALNEMEKAALSALMGDEEEEENDEDIEGMLDKKIPKKPELDIKVEPDSESNEELDPMEVQRFMMGEEEKPKTKKPVAMVQRESVKVMPVKKPGKILFKKA